MMFYETPRLGERVRTDRMICHEIVSERYSTMVERRIELTRRYHRKKKMLKLKARLAAAVNEGERQKILAKILRLSPDWKPLAQK